MKKKMYLEACHQQRRHFSPFVTSTNRLMEVDTMANLKRMARCLAKHWCQPYLRTCGYINIRVAIILVRATHRCMQGSRVLAQTISVVGRRWRAQLIQVSAPRYPKTGQFPLSAPNPISHPGEECLRHHRDFHETENTGVRIGGSIKAHKGGEGTPSPLEYIEHKPSITK